MEKITKKVAFGQALEALKAQKADEAVIEVIEKAIAQLDKKSGEKKPTKVQIANEVTKEAILTYLASVPKATIKDITLNAEGCADLSSQKVTALVSALVKDAKVVRTMDKKVAYFALA